jgi:hypothetical protein
LVGDELCTSKAVWNEARSPEKQPRRDQLERVVETQTLEQSGKFCGERHEEISQLRR